MKTFYLFIAANIFLIGCFNSKKDIKNDTGESKISKYQYCFSFPVFNKDGSLSYIEDTVDVYNGDVYTLYRFPNGYSTLSHDDTLIRKTKVYLTAVQKRDEKKGYLFRSDTLSENFEIIDMDSIIATKAIFTSDLFIGEGLRYTGSRIVNDDYVSVYALIKKNDEFSVDSVLCFYNKAALGINYTFSNSIDTFKNIKLYRINMIGNPFISKSHNLSFARFEYNYQVAKCRLSNADIQYYSLFAKFLAAQAK